MSYKSFAALSLLWIIGIATIIGSSLEEERPPPLPPVPVTVQFSLVAPSGLERKLETRTDDINGLTLLGIYSANQGEQLTLDRSTLALAVTSGFTVLTTADVGTDELLMGESFIVITALFDASLTGNPDSGRFTSDFAETTTTVTVTSSGVDALVEGSAGAVSYNWSEFESAEDDETLSLDLRMASAAYNILDAILVTARTTENLLYSIDDNKSMIEAMNLDSPLSLSCDNTATNASLELRWTLDPAGSGQGTVSVGDEFEAEYSNCQTASLGVYLDGRILLDNYDPDENGSLETVGIIGDLNPLYLSDAAINSSPTPGSVTPRLKGKLSISLQELSDSQ